MSFCPWLKFALKHIPDNSDENPIENLDSWYETEAKAKATQTANIGQEIKPGHPLGFLVLWRDRITYWLFYTVSVTDAADIHKKVI